jgi:bacteriocin-like protein
MTPTTLQTEHVQELTDEQLQHVNGGFFWFFFPVIAKLVTVAAGATAS